MRLVWTRQAKVDLAEIFDFILQDRPQAAVEVLDNIEQTALRLVEHPGMGRPGRVANTREIVVPGLPWILPYLNEPDTITILRVLHTARKWPGNINNGGGKP